MMPLDMKMSPPPYYYYLFTTPIAMTAAAAETVSPEVQWNDVAVVSDASEREAAMQLIEAIRPLVPGKIAWEEAYTNTTRRRSLRIHLNLQSVSIPELYFYSDESATLYIRWSQGKHRAHTAAFAKTLQSFTKNGVLQPVSREQLEDALKHHVVYLDLDWSDVQIVCSPQNLPYAQAWANSLRPHIEGKLCVRPQSQETQAGITLRLITLEGPTQARLRWAQDNSIVLQVTDSGDVPQNMQQAFAEFLRILQPFMKNGKIGTMKDGDLAKALRAGFHQEVVTWDNIVICSLSEDEARPWMDALRPLTNGKIRWRKTIKGELTDASGLGNDYLCIVLTNMHNCGAYIRLKEGILPTIRINREPTPRNRMKNETEEQYRERWSATSREMHEKLLRLLQQFQVNGKLQPTTVKELQSAIKGMK